MTARSDLLQQAKEFRASATRAQRLADGWGLGKHDDIAVLWAYAAELDQKARALEARALAEDLYPSSPVPIVTHAQQQMQQQQSEAAPNPQAKGPAHEK